MEEVDHSCGLRSWRPQCLQSFANYKMFIVFYGLLGTIQAMGFIYFVATLTTVEKRFEIPSQTTGILMTGNEISQILLSLYLSYRGGRGNRPLWIAWGVGFSAISCYILASPHFIYGPGANALALTKEYLDVHVLNSSTHIESNNSQVRLCSDVLIEDSCNEYDKTNATIPLVLIFLSQFVLGIGTTLYYSLGQSYMDDNTKKTNTPLLIGVTFALRTAGPAVGFAVGFACLNMYIDPTLTPMIDKKDPRWLGAWWLGWLVLGTTMLLLALILAMFPKQLKPPEKKSVKDMDQEESMFTHKIIPTNLGEAEEDSLYKEYKTQNILVNGKTEEELRFAKEKVKELIDTNNKATTGPEETFTAAMKRILKNKIIMLNNLTTVFYILGASGYITFFSKYVESQYHESAASANMIAGTITILAMVVGFLIAGFVIAKYKPSTSKLLLWNILVGCVYVGGQVTYLTTGCPDDNLHGSIVEGNLNATTACNSQCSCDGVKFTPVCYEAEKAVFFSACHAGCTSTHEDENGLMYYSQCSCLPDSSDIVKSGICDVDCSGNFYIFLFISITIQLFGCSGKITNALVNYRGVETRDKSLAQGFALFTISLFAFIPGPIIYGRLIDNTCLVWNNSCGSKGNCWLYDKRAFRYAINSGAIVFTSLAVITDVALWWFGKDMKIYEENENKDGKEKK